METTQKHLEFRWGCRVTKSHCVSADLEKYHIYYKIDIKYCELYNSTV